MVKITHLQINYCPRHRIRSIQARSIVYRIQYHKLLGCVENLPFGRLSTDASHILQLVDRVTVLGEYIPMKTHYVSSRCQ